MTERMKRLLADEEGVTMVEYALLLGLISIAAITLLSPIGGKVHDWFQKVLDSMSTSS